MTKRHFGELELTILRALKSGEKKSVRNVHKHLGEKDNYNTIMTVMARLAEKGYLAREKVGLHYEYWLLPSKEKVPSFFAQLKQKLFGIKTTELISYLIDSSEEMDKNDFDELENLIKEAKEKRAL
jgi:predicted transcriptional regulator